ncbi:SDR family NAD(P)-dependent oxidoreductase [Catenuloplanes japonicus]|uniref:SDR family NAD(P)-dependent oxidoreductase n=1 Tax=Catenuloplanes japonicus TaxID=33876 RepID=UPI000524C1AB|nr:SDR family oxidoreductase [Catenuloplanes japonicus]
MDLGLKGRTVIVTGGSGGIGRHLVRRFEDEGADVISTHHGNGDGFTFDLGDDPAALIDTALSRTGRIDVLVNNAVRWGSAVPRPDALFETVPDDEWLGVVRDNIEGAIRLSRAVAPHLRAQRWGRLVHISSGLAVDGAAGSEYYGAAKAALHGFSRSVAYGLGGSGDILSNVVMIGLTRTERNAFIVDGAGPAPNPAGRWLDAEEVAAPVVFLSSAANTGITGQIIPVM